MPISTSTRAKFGDVPMLDAVSQIKNLKERITFSGI
jgi:hypothetical protein